MARAEARALLEIVGCDPSSFLTELNLGYVFTSDENVGAVIAQRAALAKMGLKHAVSATVEFDTHSSLLSSDVQEAQHSVLSDPPEPMSLVLIEKMLAAADLSELTDKTFIVRVRRSFGAHRSFTTPFLERHIGAMLLQLNPECRVDLHAPDLEMVFLLNPSSMSIGRKLFDRTRPLYDERAPHSRKFFKPGAMRPEIARSMVNLARATPQDVFLDPFGGTGGLVMEASMMSIPSIVGELQRFASAGALRNIRNLHQGGDLAGAYVGTATALPFKQIGAIAGDPPYRISSSSFGIDVHQLTLAFLKQVKGTLKRGGHVCVSLPLVHHLDEIFKEAGLKVVDQAVQRVHGSLSRHFVVGKNDS